VAPFWVPDRGSLSFPAFSGDLTIRFLVPADVLVNRFGATGTSSQELAKAFEANRDEIYRAAFRSFEDSRHRGATEIVLDSSYFPRKTTAAPASASPRSSLRVTYSPMVEVSPELRSLADEASDFLAAGLGGSVPYVTAHWEANEDKGILELTLGDRETQASARDWFRLDQLKDRLYISKRFTQLWAELLRARMHKQLETIRTGAEDS
jgi:hypothetical protein